MRLPVLVWPHSIHLSVGFVIGFLLTLSGCNNNFETQPASVLFPIQQQRVGDYVVTLLSPTRQLTAGPASLVLEFHRPSDHKLAEVSNVQISVQASNGKEPRLQREVPAVTDGTPGRYQLETEFPSHGIWWMVIGFNDRERARLALNVMSP